MKKLLAMLLVLVALVGCLVVSASAASNKSGYCEQCKATVTWEPLTTFGTLSVTGHKHYYISANKADCAQIVLKSGNVCLDLNGKQLTFNKGRAFLLYESSAAAPAILSIQDSVGGATVTSVSWKKTNADGSSSSTNNGAGGVAWVDNYCTMNIHGGSYFLDVQTPNNKMTSTGGILAIYNSKGGGVPGGVVNMYGGTLNGADVSWVGGAVDLQSDTTFNVYGGSIISGTAQAGKCVNIRNNKSTKSGTIKLYNNARVDDIYYMNGHGADYLYVDSSFTGETFIKSSATVGANVTIGTTNGAFTGGVYMYHGNGYKAVVSGTNLNLTTLASGQRLKDCVHCGRMACWSSFTTTSPSAAGNYHYYLTQNYTTSTAKQISVNENVTYCLDLNGKSYSTTGRSFNIGGSNGLLNVMDLVGGGSVNGSSGSNNPGGGTVSISGGTKGMNLYSGTLTYTAQSSQWNGTGRGGVIQTAAPVNIYGGKIIGGEVTVSSYSFTGINGAGGAIYASAGPLNIYGGEITSGKCPETGAGPCIYVAGTSIKVLVQGDAKVDDITFSGFKADQLTVSGAFTGKLGITYPASTKLSEKLPIGIAANNCDLKKADITCGDYFVHAEDGKLVLSSYSAGIPAATGGVGYNTLQAAIDACTDGNVELLNDTPENVTISKDITLQLNGCSVTGGITVAEGATLYLKDAATDDFTVADGIYGKVAKVTGNVTGAANGSDTYLLLSENGAISAHLVRLNIHTMTLRVDNTDDKQEPGLYYKSDFKGDEKIAPQIDSYGVALSVMTKPDATNLESSDIRYTAHDHFEGGADGNRGHSSSTLLTGILKEQNSDAKNKRNLNLNIYGRAYAKTADGQVIVGNLVERSLLEQLQAIDQMVPSLAEIQVTGVVKLYNKFGILENYEIPGIKNAVETHEEGTLKVLLLGNSHGLDATNLLYEVFYNEAPEKKVVIAALYYGGCQVYQHKNFAQGNQEVYTYHKNDGSQPNRKWVVKDSTIMDALEDEQWDIVLMQQMNTQAGVESNYKASDWKYVADYLLENQDHQPKLGFHVTWANPDDYELFLNDDAPYNIRYISTYSDPTSWRKNHEKYFPTAEGKYSTDVMYQQVMALTQKYLIDSTDFLGRDYFDDQYLMNSATPIHYALTVLGREQLHLYRDYTHMSDYGRLICAYQWYAQLMGLEEITEVNMDTIPTVLKHNNSKFPVLTGGVYPVTQDMKDDLIESVNWALKNPWNMPE